MAESLAQLNVRIDAGVKRKGDAALSRLGVSSAQAVRSLWEYLARTGEMPECLMASDGDLPDYERLARDGAGMAVRLAQEKGIACSFNDVPRDAMRQQAYEELMAERQVEHA